MEDNDEEMEGGENIWVDMEWVLQVLLAMGGDEKVRTEIINHISEKSSVAPEKVEEILHVLTELLLEDRRSN